MKHWHSDIQYFNKDKISRDIKQGKKDEKLSDELTSQFNYPLNEVIRNTGIEIIKYVKKKKQGCFKLCDYALCIRALNSIGTWVNSGIHQKRLCPKQRTPPIPRMSKI